MSVNLVNALFDQFQFHPEIKKVSEKLFKDGHYAQAILEAFKLVVKCVKDKSGRTDLDGKRLMAEVFRKEMPTLLLNALQTQSEKDEQEGFMFLFMGAVVGIRNPKAHDFILQTDPWRTLDYIAFASLLMRRVDESKISEKNKPPVLRQQESESKQTANRKSKTEKANLAGAHFEIVKKIDDWLVIKCAYCKGKGKILTTKPFDPVSACPACKGKGHGKLKEPIIDCLYCNGTGKDQAGSFASFFGDSEVCAQCHGLGAQSL